jgi:hypothetical protein
MVENEQINHWMSLFLQESFPPRKELYLNQNNNNDFSSKGKKSKGVC